MEAIKEEEYVEPNHWTWVGDAIKHRQILKIQNDPSWIEESEANGWVVIDNSTTVPDDLWICDMCNNSLDILLPIAIWCGSRAMCSDCMTDIEKNYKTSYDTYEYCDCGCSKGMTPNKEQEVSK